MSSPAKPPFHVEHIGSFLRPARLLEAARKVKAGTLDADGLRKVTDEVV